MMENKIHRVKIYLDEAVYDELSVMAIESNQTRNGLMTSILNTKIDITRQYESILKKETQYLKHAYKSILGEETKFEATLVRMFRVIESLSYLQHEKYKNNPELMNSQLRYIEYNLIRLRAGLPLEQPYQSMEKATSIEEDLEIQRRINEIEKQSNLDILDEEDDNE